MSSPASPGPDLCACGLLSDLPRRFLNGQDLDLLRPLRLVLPGDEAELAGTGGAELDRGPLAEALADRNRSYGHPAGSRLAASLAEPSTLVVITGQQCGLAGGPLFTLTKAAAAVLWAEELTRRGSQAVPLFWMASEDHDYAEVARACFPPTAAKELTLGDDPAPLAPVGHRKLGAGATALLDRVLEASPSDDYRRRISECRPELAPDCGFTESFARLMIRFLGERCPLLVDSQLPALKEASAPVIQRAIDRRREVDDALGRAADELRQRAIRLPVRSRPGESPFFLVGDDGARRRVIWEGDDGYRLRGGGAGSVSELEERLLADPRSLSPGVLARPAIQDAAFGTALTILGPGELGYMTQARALHEELDIRAPSVALRPQVLLMGVRERRWLEALRADGLDLDAILSRPEELDRLLANRCGLGFVASARDRLETLVDDLSAGHREIDPQLESAWTKTAANLRRTLERFERRAVAAAARRDETLRGRALRLREHCLPGGALQERQLTSLHCLASYGDELVRALERLDRNPRHLQILWLEAR